MSESSRPRLQTLWQFVGALIAAAPCVYLSWVLFSVWAEPMAWDDGNWVRFGVGLMLMEFVLLHSGAFMATALAAKTSRQKHMLYAGMVLFYGLMVLGFALSLDSQGLLWIFAAVVLGRVFTALTNRVAGMSAMLARSSIGIICYLFVVFGTVFIPIPEWGINHSVLNEVYPNRGSGVWEKEPQRAIVGAAVYFMLMGLAELFLLGPNWMTVGEKPRK